MNEAGTEKQKKGSRFTITARITMWYSLFLVLIAAALMGVLLHFYSERSQMTAETRLIKIVDEVANSISVDGEDFIFDNKIQYYYKDVYISVYDANEQLLVGRRPRRIDNFPGINISGAQTVEDSAGMEWYVYDTPVRVDGKELFIRGMLSREEEGAGGSFELMSFVILLPIIFLLAGLGGYLITRQAFAPVREIIKTTEEIRKDGDLSRRIPLNDSRDEIHDLAESFNGMFQRIEEMVKREKQFTADASHELRTPISVIQAQSEFAMEEPEYASEAASVINRVSRGMSALITNLLMISRSDAGRLTPNKKYLDAGELIKEVVEVKQSMAEQNDSRIEASVQPNLYMNTDEDMLTRIAINLIDNAIKYGAHTNGVVKVSTYFEGNDLVLRVSDNGKGINEVYRDRIWERFYRTDTARTGSDSNGLGLSIVQTMTNSLGGSARLLPDEESELGGASFEIRIPQK